MSTFNLGSSPAGVIRKNSSAALSSTFTTAAMGSFVAVTGLSCTVTVPAGGRSVKISAFLAMNNSGATYFSSAIYKDGSLLSQYQCGLNGATTYVHNLLAVDISPSAGSHTYAIYIAPNGGTTNVLGSPGGYGAVGGPSIILVEPI